MRTRLMLAVALAATAAPAVADDVPFAQPPVGVTASLADLMLGVQLRHIKLAQAIRTENFPLAQFEARLIADSLAAAAMLYRNIPIDYINAAAGPAVDLREAAAKRDAAALAAAYGALNDACNACHAAADVPFIAIRNPSSQPFRDQDFAPKRR